MINKTIIYVLALSMLSGCELLNRVTHSTGLESNQSSRAFCIWKENNSAKDCNIQNWLTYWSKVEDIEWPERKKRIASLSSSKTDLLKKIFLSQSKSTPYQNRLRAQAWIESLFPQFSEKMRRFITVAIYHPSQDLLEMESALVTLSKVNAFQAENLQEHQALIKKQQLQIEQLLNIEATLIDNTQEGSK